MMFKKEIKTKSFLKNKNIIKENNNIISNIAQSQKNLIKISDEKLIKNPNLLNRKEKYYRDMILKNLKLKGENLRKSLEEEGELALEYLNKIPNVFYKNVLDVLIEEKKQMPILLSDLQISFINATLKNIIDKYFYFPYIYHQYSEKQLKKYPNEVEKYNKKLYDGLIMKFNDIMKEKNYGYEEKYGKKYVIPLNKSKHGERNTQDEYTYSKTLYARPEPSKIYDSKPELTIQKYKNKNAYFELFNIKEENGIKTSNYILSDVAIEDIKNKKLYWGIAIGIYFNVKFNIVDINGTILKENEIEKDRSVILKTLKNNTIYNIRNTIYGQAIFENNAWIINKKGLIDVDILQQPSSSETITKQLPEEPEKTYSTKVNSQPSSSETITKQLPEEPEKTYSTKVNPENTNQPKQQNPEKITTQEYNELLKTKRLELIKNFEKNSNNIRILSKNIGKFYKNILKSIPNKLVRQNYMGAVLIKNLITLEYDYEIKQFISLFEDRNVYKNEKMKMAFLKEPVMKFNVIVYSEKGKRVKNSSDNPQLILYLYKNKIIITDVTNGKIEEILLENT